MTDTVVPVQDGRCRQATTSCDEARLWSRQLTHVSASHACFLCRSLAYPPVTLPCGHCTCSTCFESIERLANMECPLCRKRLHAWHRRLRGKVIDQDLQTQLRELYTDLCRKIDFGENVEDDIEVDDHEFEPNIHLAKDGEIHEEYMEEVRRIEKAQQEEEKASMRLIQELQAKEEEERRRQHEIELRDRTVAQRLAMDHQPGSSVPSSSSHRSDSTSNIKRRKTISGAGRAGAGVAGSRKGGKARRKSHPPSRLLKPKNTLTIKSFFSAAADASHAASSSSQAGANATPQLHSHYLRDGTGSNGHFSTA